MTDKEAKETEEIKAAKAPPEETGGDNEPEVRQEERKSNKEKSLESMSKEELLEKVNDLQEKAEEDHDQFLRAKAEIDNVIKRSKKEKEDWIKFSNETLIKEILPVIDNLEKAIAHSKDENSLQALREGVELTLKGLKDTLAKSGVEKVESEGEPFDPNFHHAVSEQEDKDVDSGVVLKELQKGYTLNQRLIRPAMVVLSKGKPETENSQDK